MTDTERRTRSLEDALRWIRHIANIHYLGQAFDPEHMAAISEFADGALRGEPVPDFAQAMVEAKNRAKVLAEEIKGWAE